MTIKTIIFDFGKVLYNFDPKLSEDALAKLNIQFMQHDFVELQRDQLIDAFEKGMIDRTKFCSVLKDTYNSMASISDIEQACCAMMQEFPAHRIEMLMSLRHDYQLLLLSNTNEMHIDLVNRQMRCTYQMQLQDLFDTTYLSYEMGMRKPNEQIYQRVIAEQGLVASESVFIDDFKENVVAAQGCGLQAIHLKEDEDVCDIVATYLADEAHA